MSVVAEFLDQMSLRGPAKHENLTIYPITARTDVAPDYITLDEALGRGCARVTEVSESGSVPELRFVNDCDRRVLLVDGEELVGAKQNRILNLSVLVAAHTTIVIPVSCVEAGRWRYDADAFSSSGRAHYASGRAMKLRAVSESLSREGSRRSDQAEVWADISDKAARMDARSSTKAAAAMYETHRTRIEEYLGAFEPADKQAGAQ